MSSRSVPPNGRLLAAALMLIAAPAFGEPPQVTVKARSWIDDLHGLARGRVAEISGVLRDNLRQPVAGAAIHLTPDAGAEPSRLTTGPDGRFRATLRFDDEGEHTVTVDHPAGPLLAGARARVVLVLGRAVAHLSAEHPDPAPAHQPLTLAIRAVDTGGAPLPGLKLTGDLDGQPLPPLKTGAGGVAPLEIESLPPGRHRLVVAWAGDDALRPARLDHPFEAATRLVVELRYAGPSPAPVATDPELTGTLTTGPGPGVTVTLTADGKPVAHALTTADGSFRFVVPHGELREGVVTFRALAHAPPAHAVADGWRDGFSDRVRIRIPPPPPPSPIWVWAPVALAGLSLLGAAWRHRPRRRIHREAPEGGPPAPPPFELTQQGGAQTVTTTPGLLEIRVLDALDGRPLEADVVLLPALAMVPDPASCAPPRGGTRERTGADGTARLEGAGDRLWVGREGYAPECHLCPSPPGGRAVVRLTPIRARIQTLYARCLHSAGRPALRFGRQTPREAASSLTRRGATPEEVTELTRRVEAACFGPETPDAAALAAAYRLVATVRADLRRAP